MGLFDKVKNFGGWIKQNIVFSGPYDEGSFEIPIIYNYRQNAAKHWVWYRGKTNELLDFYLPNAEKNYSFYAGRSTEGHEIPRVHSGVPKDMVKLLKDITIDDLNSIEFKDEKSREIWEKIEKENEFKKLFGKATTEMLVVGDGAFKIGFEPEISEYPILEFVPGDRVEYVRVRGRIVEIIFYSYYEVKGVKYTLAEHYGYGYIKYKLYKGESDKEISLDTINITKGLEDVSFDEKAILAFKYSVWESEIYEGRGESIFENKTDLFDTMDEILSTIKHNARFSKAKLYVPTSKMGRNSKTGQLLRPNSFDLQIFEVKSVGKEGVSDNISIEQADILNDQLEAAYYNFLNLALQGLISPSTLGIDVKKLDNAEATREKEKVTLYTRQTIIEAMKDTIQKLVITTFYAYQMQNKQVLEEVECSPIFGEYSSPSFEAVIETMAKARPGKDLISIEAQVDEMWGDDKTEEWKAEEVKRLIIQRNAQNPALEGVGLTGEEATGTDEVKAQMKENQKAKKEKAEE